jgi:hypothetical protein
VRFETRYDRWLVIVLLIAAVFTCLVIPALIIAGRGPHAPPSWIPFVPWGLWLAVLVSTLPQYYETREDGLFLRQGWKKRLLPYDSLVELRSTTDARSAGVFSMQRINITTREGRRFIIAVAEEDLFFATVAERCPQLARSGFGLAITLSPPAAS